MKMKALIWVLASVLVSVAPAAAARASDAPDAPIVPSVFLLDRCLGESLGADGVAYCSDVYTVQVSPEKIVDIYGKLARGFESEAAAAELGAADGYQDGFKRTSARLCGKTVASHVETRLHVVTQYPRYNAVYRAYAVAYEGTFARAKADTARAARDDRDFCR